jgi:hypothetical protein
MVTLKEAQELAEIVGWLDAICMDSKPEDTITITPGFKSEIRRALEIANLIQYDIEAELSGE